MKISITGHTEGIGKALADTLSQYHSVQGYSRSNGFDISTASGIDRVIDAVASSDVFINNAYADYAQTEIFKRLFEQWRLADNKTIVNIISRAKYQPGAANNYYAFKKELSKACTSALFSEKMCRIININPGYVRTNAINHIPETHPCLTVEECADIVVWALNAPDGVEIGELSFWRFR